MEIFFSNSTIGWTAFSIAISGIAIFLIYVCYFSVNSKKIPVWYSYSANIFMFLVALFYLSAFYLRYSENPYHVINLIGLSLFAIFISVFRSGMDLFDSKFAKKDYKPYIIQNFRDGMWNVVFFLSTYSAVVYVDNDGFRYSGYLLCTFNIFRYFKYRFWDDLFDRTLSCENSYLGHKSNPNIALAQGLFNLLLRTYLFIAYSFGCIYILMAHGEYEQSPLIFKISQDTRSGDILVDFMYFSIITMSTVGYGDISPVAASAKFVCIFQIIFGYLFIGSVFALVISRYQPEKTSNHN